MKVCFRLLTEYHSFLLGYSVFVSLKGLKEFPSPYGVSFILIKKYLFCIEKIEDIVSVSLRSIIHSYFKRY